MIITSPCGFWVILMKRARLKRQNSWLRSGGRNFPSSLIGWMCLGRKGHALYMLVLAENAALSALQLEHEHLMQKIGLPPEARKYAPHITLARFGGIVQPHDVSRFLGERGEFIPMNFEAESFAIFSARQSIGGGPYVVEREYPLL